MSQKVPEDSRWQLLELANRSRDGDLRRVVMFERLDVTGPPRLWWQGLIDEAEWIRVDGQRDGSRLQIDLPPDDFYGLPARMSLECPRHVVTGSLWTLRGEDDKAVIATFSCARILPQSAADVVRIETFYRRGPKPKQPDRKS